MVHLQRRIHRKDSTPPARRGWGGLLGIYAVSGFCALALETIWIRAFAVRMGNTVVSATLVITAFFLCAAVGNLWGGRLARRVRRPIRAYGLLELAVGGSALALFLLRDVLYSAVFHILPLEGGWLHGAHLLYVVLVIGVPSFLAGGAFPLLTEAFVEGADRRTAVGGGLYAGNLLGAAAGVLGGGMLLPWLWGYSASFVGIIIIQGLLGLTVLWAARGVSAREVEGDARGTLTGQEDAARDRRTPGLGFVILVASGILSIMLEMLAMSYFQQLTAGSLYAMSAVLFAFIVNLGAGGMLAAFLRRRGVRAGRILLVALALSGIQLLFYPAFLHKLLSAGLLPPEASVVGWALHAVLMATVLFAPLLLCVGMVFPLAWEIIERGNGHHGQVMGHAVAVNKVGSALGAFLGPFLLVPLLGLPVALMLAGWLYLLLAVAVALWEMRQRVVLGAAMLVLLVVAVVMFRSSRPPVALQAGEKLLATYQGANGVTAVTADGLGSRHIVLNQNYTLNGTSRALLSQRQESWIPLLFCPQPRRVAFIGMASGISATAALDYPISDLTAVELVPEVARAAREHFAAWNAPLFSDPRARVIVNDGRYVIQSSREQYDLIICDLFLPSLEGVSNLYSRDFFAAARGKLAAQGRFCLWLPAYQLDDELLGIVLRSYLEVFPHAVIVRGNLDPEQPTIGLIGANEPIDISTDFLTRQLKSEAARRIAGQSPFFRSVANFRLLLIGDLATMRDKLRTIPLNTDDYPIFAFRGPKRIEQGGNLRGIPFLNWFGRRFRQAGFPSCALGNTPAAEVVNGMRAGNYYYAASVAGMEIPVDLGRQLVRDQRKEHYLDTARRISPESDLGVGELGR